MSDAGDNNPLPILNNSNQEIKKSPTMTDTNFKMIAAFMGFNDTATVSEVQTKITELRNKAEQADALQLQLNDFKKKEEDSNIAESVLLLNEAIKEGRIKEEQRAQFSDLFKSNFDSTKTLLGSMAKQVNLSDVPKKEAKEEGGNNCLLYTSPSPRDRQKSRMPSSA